MFLFTKTKTKKYFLGNVFNSLNCIMKILKLIVQKTYTGLSLHKQISYRHVKRESAD
jgi:hypothetical protein